MGRSRRLDSVSEWHERALGECVDFLAGYPFASDGFTENPSDMRLVRGENVANGSLHWERCKRSPSGQDIKLRPYRLVEGDVVLAMDGMVVGGLTRIARVRRDDLPALLVQRVARLRGTNRMDQRFLTYLLSTNDFRDYLWGVQTGTTISHVSGGQILGYKVRVPPIFEQRAIASILGSLDDKIELNRRMNQTLEQIAQALFKSWFVDFDPVRAKADGRWRKGESLPGMPAEMWDLWPSEFEESEIGEIPKGWQIRPLSEVASFTRGVSYRGEDLADSETALVNLKCAGRAGRYREDGLKAFRGAFKDEQVVHAGDVVVSHTDVTQRAEVIGRAYRVRPSSKFKRLVASLDMAIVRPTGSGQTKEYLAYALADERFADHAYGYTNGTTVLHLSSQALPTFPHLVPATEIVEWFTRMISPLSALEDSSGLESGDLIAVRDALLPKLLSGEIRVPVDEGV